MTHHRHVYYAGRAGEIAVTGAYLVAADDDPFARLARELPASAALALRVTVTGRCTCPMGAAYRAHPALVGERA